MITNWYEYTNANRRLCRCLRQLIICSCAVAFFSCSNTDRNVVPDSPTSGNAKFFVEEGFTTIMETQLYTFHQIYKNAKINCTYTDEKTAIESLFNDTCKVIAISRQLSKDELLKFKSANLYPISTCIGQTAVVLLVNNNFKDSIISMPRLKALLQADSGTTKIMFDNQNSGCARYLNDSILGGKGFGKNCFSAGTTKELFEKINSSDNVIGILDFGWLSDQDNTQAKEILKNKHLLAVSRTENDLAYFPDQSNIKTGNYPMPRWMYIHRRAGDFTLSAGIHTFIAGEKGQLMLLKAGLVPFRQEERVIQVDFRPPGQ